jgi:hypothetical protein
MRLPFVLELADVRVAGSAPGKKKPANLKP